MNRPHMIPQPGTENNYRVILVDLKELKIIADRTFSTKIQALGLDAHHVYVGGSGVNTFYALSLKDLSDVKRIFTTSTVTAFQPVGNKLLFVTMYRSGPDMPPAIAYTLPDLQPIPEEKKTNFRRDGWASDIPALVGREWFYRGAFYDHAFSKVIGCQLPPGIPSISATPDLFRRNDGAPTASPWATHISGMAIYRMGGSQVGRLEKPGAQVLAEAPAAAAVVNVRLQDRPGQPGTKARWELVLAELTSGKVLQRIVLQDEAPPAPEYDRHGEPPAQWLFPAQGALVAVIGSQLQVIPTTVIEAKQFPVPLHFPPQQPIATVMPAKSSQVKFAAAGGRAPVEYSLAAEVPWLQIDKATGTVTIDGSKCVEPAMTTLTRLGGQMMKWPGTPPPTADGVLATMRETASAQYKLLIGTSPSGMAVSIPITVVARDSEQQTSTLQTVALLDLPMPAVAAALQKAEQEEAAVKQPPAGPDRPAGEGSDPSSLTGRAEELERQIRQLEAENRLLRELLQ